MKLRDSIPLPDSEKLAEIAALIQPQPCHVHSRNSHTDNEGKEEVEGIKSSGHFFIVELVLKKSEINN